MQDKARGDSQLVGPWPVEVYGRRVESAKDTTIKTCCKDTGRVWHVAVNKGKFYLILNLYKDLILFWLN